jgi:sigma-B regulation protein RsbU (phosphoserine phosphatase)
MPENNSQPISSIHKHHLETLIDYTLTINSFKDIDRIITHFLLTLMGKFLISKITFYIFENDRLRLVQSKGIQLDSKYSEIELKENDFAINTKISELMSDYSIQHFKQVKLDDKLLGIILFSFHTPKTDFEGDEINLFESIVSLTSVVIENSLMIQNLDEVNRKLQTKISQTRSLFELSKEFSLLLDENDVYKFLSYTVMGNFMITRFALIELNGEQKSIIGSNFEEEKFQKFLDNLDTTTIHSPIVLNQSNSINTISGFGISLIIPIEIKNKVTGLMICGERITKNQFSEDEIEFLQSIGSIAAISLENIKLFREMIEKQKIEEDIRIAREIQKNLFPKSFPQSTCYELFGMNIPSKKVGGDYFDCFRIDESRILILISDVVGKGIPASLIMSNLQAMIKVITNESFEIKEATKVINNLMKKNLSSGNFITFFWGILDEKNKTFEYVNAGHNPPFLIRENEIKKLEKGGIILGVMEVKSQYESEIIELKKDDLICLYTDGFIEATDKMENEFSEKRFLGNLIKYKNHSLEIITNKIIDDVLSYSANPDELDDLTILLARVK